MTTFNGSIIVVAGDDIDIERTVLGVPVDQILTKAWCTFKSKPSADDPGLLQKTIVSLVTGDGEITDTGSSGTGSLLFQLSGTDTLTLPIGSDVHYDIKVLTSGGKIYTAEQGIYLARARITDAVA